MTRESIDSERSRIAGTQDASAGLNCVPRTTFPYLFEATCGYAIGLIHCDRVPYDPIDQVISISFLVISVI